MNSTIKRGGRFIRPGFNWQEHKPSTPADAATGQIVESLRNLSEDGFQRLISLNEQMLRTLNRIDRHLRARRPRRKGATK